ncbi:MAG: hypothetical protein LBC77_05535 [Spirochaetaceae bacterium]|nr:hypothetical protein [Spirochaetaceae bacterium]
MPIVKAELYILWSGKTRTEFMNRIAWFPGAAALLALFLIFISCGEQLEPVNGSGGVINTSAQAREFAKKLNNTGYFNAMATGGAFGGDVSVRLNSGSNWPREVPSIEVPVGVITRLYGINLDLSVFDGKRFTLSGGGVLSVDSGDAYEGNLITIPEGFTFEVKGGAELSLKSDGTEALQGNVITIADGGKLAIMDTSYLSFNDKVQWSYSTTTFIAPETISMAGGATLAFVEYALGSDTTSAFYGIDKSSKRTGFRISIGEIEGSSEIVLDAISIHFQHEDDTYTPVPYLTVTAGSRLRVQINGNSTGLENQIRSGIVERGGALVIGDGDAFQTLTTKGLFPGGRQHIQIDGDLVLNNGNPADTYSTAIFTIVDPLRAGNLTINSKMTVVVKKSDPPASTGSLTLDILTLTGEDGNPGMLKNEKGGGITVKELNLNAYGVYTPYTSDTADAGVSIYVQNAVRLAGVSNSNLSEIFNAVTAPNKKNPWVNLAASARTIFAGNKYEDPTPTIYIISTPTTLRNLVVESGVLRVAVGDYNPPTNTATLSLAGTARVLKNAELHAFSGIIAGTVDVEPAGTFILGKAYANLNGRNPGIPPSTTPNNWTQATAGWGKGVINIKSGAVLKVMEDTRGEQTSGTAGDPPYLWKPQVFVGKSFIRLQNGAKITVDRNDAQKLPDNSTRAYTAENAPSAVWLEKGDYKFDEISVTGGDFIADGGTLEINSMVSKNATALTDVTTSTGGYFAFKNKLIVKNKVDLLGNTFTDNSTLIAGGMSRGTGAVFLGGADILRTEAAAAEITLKTRVEVRSPVYFGFNVSVEGDGVGGRTGLNDALILFDRATLKSNMALRVDSVGSLSFAKDGDFYGSIRLEKASPNATTNIEVDSGGYVIGLATSEGNVSGTGGFSADEKPSKAMNGVPVGNITVKLYGSWQFASATSDQDYIHSLDVNGSTGPAGWDPASPPWSGPITENNPANRGKLFISAGKSFEYIKNDNSADVILSSSRRNYLIWDWQ